MSHQLIPSLQRVTPGNISMFASFTVTAEELAHLAAACSWSRREYIATHSYYSGGHGQQVSESYFGTLPYIAEQTAWLDADDVLTVQLQN